MRVAPTSCMLAYLGGKAIHWYSTYWSLAILAHAVITPAWRQWLSRQKYTNLYYTVYVLFGDCFSAVRLMLVNLSMLHLVKYSTKMIGTTVVMHHGGDDDRLRVVTRARSSSGIFEDSILDSHRIFEYPSKQTICSQEEWPHALFYSKYFY
jgi:hypothetical protein